MTLAPPAKPEPRPELRIDDDMMRLCDLLDAAAELAGMRKDCNGLYAVIRQAEESAKALQQVLHGCNVTGRS